MVPAVRACARKRDLPRGEDSRLCEAEELTHVDKSSWLFNSCESRERHMREEAVPP